MTNHLVNSTIFGLKHVETSQHFFSCIFQCQETWKTESNTHILGTSKMFGPFWWPHVVPQFWPIPSSRLAAGLQSGGGGSCPRQGSVDKASLLLPMRHGCMAPKRGISGCLSTFSAPSLACRKKTHQASSKLIGWLNHQPTLTLWTNHPWLLQLLHNPIQLYN